MQPKYEEQFTAFVDFLGFGDASAKSDKGARPVILELLLTLSRLRREFDVQSAPHETSTRTLIEPAISTFSDHIVVSYPLQSLCSDFGFDERTAAKTVIIDFSQWLAAIAAAALRVGFLIRGGATIGNLYHSKGVVFGEALIDAYQIESRTSVYPRVVLSSKITSRSNWLENEGWIEKDDDGLYYFDYFKMLLVSVLPPEIPGVGPIIKSWLDNVVAVINQNVTELNKAGRLNHMAKWVWFARRFRAGLESLPTELLASFGCSLDNIPWSE